MRQYSRPPEGHDYDDNDHVAAGAIVCGVILGACMMALVLYALAHL